MTDIERRLRDLGERVAAQQGPSALQPQAMRAAKRRRLTTAFGATLTVIALISGVTYAATSLTVEPDGIGPAQKNSDRLIEYRRSGGYEGSESRLTIDRQGNTVLHYTEGTDGLTVEGKLSPVELIDVEDAIAVIDWPAVHGLQELRGVGVADGYEYEFRHDDYVVTTISGAEPRSIQPLIDVLDAFIAEERARHDDSKPAGCGPPVDFEPTYLPEGWVQELQPGSGGGAAWKVVGHYGNGAQASTTDKASGGFVELFEGGSPYPLRGGEEIRVLDVSARFGPIHEGFSVEFTRNGCDYVLLGFMDGDELRRFAEGLRLKSDTEAESPDDEGSDFAAIWPEDTEERAGEECTSVQHVDGHWRTDGILTAERFAAEALDWEDAQATQSKPERGLSVYVGNGPISSDSPTVVVHVKEVFGGCWSVISVGRVPDSEPTGVSVSVRGREVQIGFDTLDATAGTVELGYGGRVETKRWVAAEATRGPVTFDLDFDPDTTGHFLILFEDEQGEVFSASGGPLPAGDFSAG